MAQVGATFGDNFPTFSNLDVLFDHLLVSKRRPAMLLAFGLESLQASTLGCLEEGNATLSIIEGHCSTFFFHLLPKGHFVQRASRFSKMLRDFAAHIRKTRVHQCLCTKSKVTLQAIGGLHVQETKGSTEQCQKYTATRHGNERAKPSKENLIIHEPSWLLANLLDTPFAFAGYSLTFDYFHLNFMKEKKTTVYPQNDPHFSLQFIHVYIVSDVSPNSFPPKAQLLFPVGVQQRASDSSTA